MVLVLPSEDDRDVRSDDHDVGFREMVHRLAPLIHERWRPSGKGSPNDVPFDHLPEETRQANLAAAERIPRVLALAGLRIVPQGAPQSSNPSAIRQTIEENLERLAEAEHEYWMDQKRGSGWVYGETRDDAAKRHPSMVPYHDLTPAEKDKDRDSVLRYPDLLRACGFEIVRIAGKTRCAAAPDPNSP